MLERSRAVREGFGPSAVLFRGLTLILDKFELNLTRFLTNTNDGRKTAADVVRVDLRPLGISRVIDLFVPAFDKGLRLDVKAFRLREPLHVYMLWRLIEEFKPRVLDLGSNVGFFPVLELEAGAPFVVAVEPQRALIPFLRANLKPYDGRSIVVNKAISAKGFNSMSLCIPATGELNHVKPVNEGEVCRGSVEHVELADINDVVERAKPDMLRMDLEGFEWMLLQALESGDIELIDLETHVSSEHDYVNAVKALENASRLGFRYALLVEGIHWFNSLAKLVSRVSDPLKAFCLAKFAKARCDDLIKVYSLNSLISRLRSEHNPAAIDYKHVLLIRGSADLGWLKRLSKY